MVTDQSTAAHQFDRFLVILMSLVTAYAVGAYGLRMGDTRIVFDALLGGTVVIWILSLLVTKRAPQIRPIMIVVPGFLLFYGWVSVFNAGFRHDWENGFLPIEDAMGIKWLPSSLNQERSSDDMVHLSALIPGFWMICDLCRSRGNRKLILQSLAVIGLIFSLIGIFQKASQTQKMLFWDEIFTERRFFSTYGYHGNAATFLNFCWPVAVALMLASKLKGHGPLKLSCWTCASLFTVAAVFINTSKIGHVLGIVMLIVFSVIYRKALVRIFKLTRNAGRTLGILSVVILAVVIALGTLSFTQSMGRWDDFQGSLKPRLETYQTCLKMIQPAGWFGMGPGTFSTAFPYYVTAENRSIDFFFHTAHEDYLQGIIEWGWVGFTLWMGLFCFVIVDGIKQVRKGSFYIGALLVGLFAASIQAVFDFPIQIGSLQWVGAIQVGIIMSFRK